MLSFTTTSTLFLCLASIASAQMLPQTPTDVTAGKTAVASWTKDTTGAWNDVTMTLMSGDNFQMIPLAAIATGIDGTSTTSYTFTVPEVSPNSAIYFLQFQPANNASAYEWTTRFLISAADGSAATPPTNTTQPNGAAIPWGVGALISGSSDTNSTSTSATVTNSATTDSAMSSTQNATTTSTSTSASSESSSSTSPSSTSKTSAAAAAASSTHTSAASRSIGLIAAPLAIAGGLVGLFTLLI